MSKLNNNKGIALFITLLFCILLILMVAAVLMKAINNATMVENNIKRMKAISLAEAGIAYSYWYLSTGQVWTDRYMYPSPEAAEPEPPNPNPLIPLNGMGKPVWIEFVDEKLADGTIGTDGIRETIKAKVSY